MILKPMLFLSLLLFAEMKGQEHSVSLKEIMEILEEKLIQLQIKQAIRIQEDIESKVKATAMTYSP